MGNEGKKGGREEEGKIVEEGTHDMRLSLNLQKHPCIHYRRGRLQSPDFCFVR